MLPLVLSSLCETSFWTRMRTHLIAPLAATLLALSACGDGGGIIGRDDPDDPPSCTSTTCGQVIVGLTDADGDFLSYAVDVVSLKLELANGTQVETLPITQRVDFAELVDLTELLTAKTVPNGTYVRAILRLDYSEADVSVEAAGLPVEAVVVDENGDALEIVDLELELDNANQVVVVPGTPALLQLDFDLAASHEVDITTTPATAVGEPFLFATIEPVDLLKFRVRGPLVSVDEAAGSYVVDLRPFNHPDAELGRFTVETTADTAFEVDGEVLDGPAALAAMADADEGTLTAAQGILDVATRAFTAEQVLAGDSVPGANFDVVIGNVVARDGNELSVRGATIVRRDNEVSFLRGPVTIQIGSNTVVTQQGGGLDTLDIDAISVGQRIHAFGVATGNDPNPGINLDATDGRVRLHVTNVIGTVTDCRARPDHARALLDRRPRSRVLHLRRHRRVDHDRRGPAELRDRHGRPRRDRVRVGRAGPGARFRDALRRSAAGFRRPDAGELRQHPCPARHRLERRRDGFALPVDGCKRDRP